MQDEHDYRIAPIDGAPTWVRILQAVVIGIVAGLALQALMSMVVLQKSERVVAPTECRKSNPAKAPQQSSRQVTTAS